jgi:hypothetical protein
MKAEAEARRLAQEARLEAAKQRDAEALARKRTEYELKLEEAAKRNAEKAEREAKEAEIQAKAKAAKEKRRIEGLKNVRSGEMENIERLQENLKKRDEHVEQLRREQAQAHEERLLRETLAAMDKEETLRRQKRREEYTRMMNLKKVADEEEKAEIARQQRLKTQMERQANQRRVALVKYHMEEELASMKKKGDVSSLQKLAGGKPEGESKQ